MKASMKQCGWKKLYSLTKEALSSFRGLSHDKKQMFYTSNLNCMQNNLWKSPTDIFGRLQIGNKSEPFTKQQEIKATAKRSLILRM